MNFQLTKLGTIGRRPLSEQIYEAMRQAIIFGDLAPGTKVTETELAKAMEVSATPVREALRRLAAEGLVVIAPWKGVTVQGVSDQEIIEIYQCREALEGLACRLAAEAMDEAGIQQLRHLMERSQAAVTTEEAVKLHSEIHNIIISCSRNARLQAMISSCNDLIMQDRHLTACNEERRGEIFGEHVNIIDAIAAGDADRAEQAMRTHVRNGFLFKISHSKH